MRVWAAILLSMALLGCTSTSSSKDVVEVERLPIDLSREIRACIGMSPNGDIKTDLSVFERFESLDRNENQLAAQTVTALSESKFSATTPDLSTRWLKKLIRDAKLAPKPIPDHPLLPGQPLFRDLVLDQSFLAGPHGTIIQVQNNTSPFAKKNRRIETTCVFLMSDTDWDEKSKKALVPVTTVRPLTQSLTRRDFGSSLKTVVRFTREDRAGDYLGSGSEITIHRLHFARPFVIKNRGEELSLSRVLVIHAFHLVRK